MLSATKINNIYDQDAENQYLDQDNSKFHEKASQQSEDDIQEVKSTIIESKFHLSCEQSIEKHNLYNGCNVDIMKSIQDNDDEKMGSYS